MATQKPTSSISYNTEAFLKEKLEAWRQAHIIQAYQYICHKGEDGDKDHIHFRVEPNRRIDTMDLQEELKEYVLGEDKPRGVRPFRPSQEEDWILYAVHDEDYMKMKYQGFQKGEKIPYEWTDIKADEDFDVEIAYIRAKASLSHSSQSMINRMRTGESALNLVLTGENPYLVKTLMSLVQSSDFERLQHDYDDLLLRFNALLKAVVNAGYDVDYDLKHERYFLSPKISPEERGKVLEGQLRFSLPGFEEVDE